MDLCKHFTPTKKIQRSISESELKSNPRSTFTERRISEGDAFIRVDDINGYSCPRKLERIAFRSCSCLQEAHSEGMPRIPSFVHLDMSNDHAHIPEEPLDGYRSVPTTPIQNSKGLDFNGNISTRSYQSSVGPLCRICLEGDNHEELISPCRCTGTMALIHKSCLERWLNLARCEKCELCRYTFSVERSTKPLWQLSLCNDREVRRSVIVDILCFLILTPLASASLYVCVSGVMYDKERHKASRKRNPHEIIPHGRWGAAAEQSQLTYDRNDYTDFNEDKIADGIAWDIVGLVMLACILIGIYLTWLSAAIVYYTKVIRHWRRANQDLVLSENHRRPSCFSVLSNTYRHMYDIESLEGISISSTRPSSQVTPEVAWEDVNLEHYTGSNNQAQTEEIFAFVPGRSAQGLSENILNVSTEINSPAPYSNIPQIYVEDVDDNQNANTAVMQ